MKVLFTLLLALTFAPIGIAQEIDEDEAEAFWETNVQAILDMDKETVLKQTHFPLSTAMGDKSEKEFSEEFETFFSKDVLADLNYQSARSIQPVEYEPGEMTYMVVMVTITEVESDENGGEGESMESATILSFKKFDGAWKLYKIDLAG